MVRTYDQVLVVFHYVPDSVTLLRFYSVIQQRPDVSPERTPRPEKKMTMALQPNTPVFPYAQLLDFRAFILKRGGSGSVHSGSEIPSDVKGIEGRYAFTYSADLPDMPGRTITFYAEPRMREYDTNNYVPTVVLTGCPWGSLEERIATYRELALSGCRPNDQLAEFIPLVEQARAE